jgi:localization factor PodJL
MKLGVPWSVKGIRPEARESAKEAARRAGMPLSDWLNSVIVHSAAEQGVSPDEEIFADGGEEIGAVNAKLDDLSRRIDRLTRGPEAYAPPHMRSQFVPPSGYGPQAYAPPHAYAPPPPQPAAYAGLDRAVAEIAARRRALNGEPQAPHTAPQPMAPPPVMHAAPPMAPGLAPGLAPNMAPMYEPPAIVRAPMPAQDLSGLEEQLRHITDQIDTLRHPGVEEAINALRGELAEISHALSDAMPRQAIDAIERQIQSLNHRIAEGRQAGVDPGALGGIEHGLAEVRDTLQHLTPAENLAGFHEAIDGLAQKIDLVVAQKDPATLQQLETAVNTLRQVSGHVASNETVGRLASDVAMLSEKIDRLASGGGAGALSGLEARIGALADALSQRSQSGVSVPPQLESLVDSLTDKIEKLQLSRGDGVAFAHLEDRIVKLVEKLDASDSRLTHLEAIERGLGDLLVNMETMRAQTGKAGGLRNGSASGVDDLKQDIARTQDEIQSVHGTLSQVVERLAMIEQGVLGEMRGPVKAPAHAAPGKIGVRAIPAEEEPLDLHVAAHGASPAPSMPAPPPAAAAPPPPPAPAARPMPMPPSQPPAADKPKRPPTRKSLPIAPDLPPDQPIEPGSGPSRFRADPAARIAASQAALGDAIPAEAPAGGKSSFLAAARRAAQAAMRDKGNRKPASVVPTEAEMAELDNDRPSLRDKLTKRVKQLFVSASMIAIVVGGVQIWGTHFNPVETTASSQKPSQMAEDAAPASKSLVQREADAASTGSAPARLPGMVPPVTPFGFAGVTPATTSQLPIAAMSSVTGLALEANSGDVTGSLGQPGPRAATPAAHPAAATTGEELPSSIGSPQLRQAAVSGNPAGAYEVAVRFAEGRGVTASASDAVRWFERAARAGLAPAQFRLGSMYEKGQGVKKDLDKARQSYLAAASQGNAKAMHNLAVLYAEGGAGKPDYANAAQWFRKASSYGIADSQYNLGILCARGLGTAKDMAESYKWFALAAAGGDKEAARKRDEVAPHIDPKALASLQITIRSWVAERQPPAAINVTEPAGGWDGPKPSQAAERKTKTTSLTR